MQNVDVILPDGFSVVSIYTKTTHSEDHKDTKVRGKAYFTKKRGVPAIYFSAVLQADKALKASDSPWGKAIRKGQQFGISGVATAYKWA